jgi:hypothetical protein
LYEDVVWLFVRTDVSEEYIASIYRLKRLLNPSSQLGCIPEDSVLNCFLREDTKS